MLGEVAKTYRKGLLQTINFLQQLHAESIEYEQQECKHEKVTFNPDPSGNNDSYYSCDICKKEESRRFGTSLSKCYHEKVSRDHIPGGHGERETRCLECDTLLS